MREVRRAGRCSRPRRWCPASGAAKRRHGCPNRSQLPATVRPPQSDKSSSLSPRFLRELMRLALVNDPARISRSAISSRK
ncbi:hypothetical protein IG631_22469 [Alternaria alternata]|nr:hypothetical protein IG631_22469 [Alternaria alternata]